MQAIVHPSQPDPDRRAPENNQGCLMHIMVITVYIAILNLLLTMTQVVINSNVRR